MKNAEYWAKRMMLLEEASHKDAEACIRQTDRAFTHARLRINSEIEKWVARIAINNELSMAEARRLLKGDELDDFHMSVEEYIALGRANGIDRKWEKQLENASARAHISKWEAMNLQIENYLREAFGRESAFLEQLLEETAKERYIRTAYEIEEGLGIGKAIDTPVVDKIVRNPWATDERIFSDRIWTHMTEMKAELQDALLQQVLTGSAPNDAIDRMQKYVSDETDNARRRAATLINTESAAIGNRAQMQCYHDLGVDEIEIVATLDSKTCSRCGSRDGLRYPENELRIGLNAPPFHANCRCCTAPYVEGFEPSQRMARDPKTGKSAYVPNMSYEEWKERYLTNAEEHDKIKADEVVTGHRGTPKSYQPGKIVDHRTAEGSVDVRTKYNSDGLKGVDIHTTDHGHQKQHPYGKHGEHAHDYTWDSSGRLVGKTTRELTQEERDDNIDIL